MTKSSVSENQPNISNLSTLWMSQFNTLQPQLFKWSSNAFLLA